MVKNKFINFFILFLFIGLWASIGSDPYNFLFIFETNNNIELTTSNINYKSIINFFRAAFPFFCLLSSLLILIKYNLIKNQKKLIYILLIIQIIQIITTFFSRGSVISNYENSIDHLGRYHWAISSTASIFIFMIASKLENFKIKTLFYISIFFLSLMVLWFSAVNIIDFYQLNSVTSIYNMNVLRDSAFFLDHQMPRVTGLSRSIIFLYIIIFYLTQNLEKFSIFFKYTLLSIMGALIFLFQSKFAMITFVIVNIFLIFNFKKKSKGMLVVLYLIITQIALFYLISNSRIIFNNQDSKKIIVSEQGDIKKEENSIKHFRQFTNTEKNNLIDHVIFTGRTVIWKNSFDYISKRVILGYGSMSDRILLNIEKIKFNKTLNENDNFKMINPISNAYLYSLISGGIFSLIIFMYFWINLRKILFNITKFNIIKNNEMKLGTLFLFIIFLRCFVENSIMLFGVDFLLLLNSIYLVENK